MKRKIAILLTLAMVLSASSMLFADAADQVTGYWKTKGGKSVVKVTKSGNRIWGKIVSLCKNPGAKCTACDDDNKNKWPYKKFADKPIKGKNIIWTPRKGYKIDGNKIEHLRIFDPGECKYYHAFMERQGNKLRVKGHLSWSSWVGKSQYWTKTSGPGCN